MSRPVRARGLKHIHRDMVGIHCLSRPVRARGLKLEIARLNTAHLDVAPRAGAWIETYKDWARCIALKSRPVRARGLKPKQAYYNGFDRLSRPVRARGLKLVMKEITDLATRSRPVRARGLKQPQAGPDLVIGPVAPRAGAWIETSVV